MPEVREALHAVPVSELDWQPCSDVLHYDVVAPLYMVDVHKDLLDAGGCVNLVVHV